MGKKFDVVAVTGKHNGKKKYKNVGMINESKEGYLSLKLDHPVTVDDEGKVVCWFNLFEPKEKPQGNNQEEENDLPF